MSNSQVPVARKQGLVVQEMPEEVLIYDLDANKAHCLNQTAAFVWKSCDGRNSVETIAELLEKEFSQKVNEDLVWLAIDQLSKERLLEREVRTDLSGMTRREVIKRIGFTAAVALPVVAMLSFPNNALANTCLNSVCSEVSGSGGCPAGEHCCRGTCFTVGVACSPTC